MALDESSIAVIGGEVPGEGASISAEMKTYNIDIAEWDNNPG